MAFVKRTWLARLGIGLNKFIIGEKDAQNKQTLTNSPDSVTQEGDTISAQNLNDLEDRIEAGFNEKQDALTFDNAPTEGSTNPVTSGGIYTALAGKQATLTFDNTPTSGSANPVTSGGIFNNTGVTKVSFADLDMQSADITLPDLQLKELCFVNALGGNTSHKIKMPTGGGRYYFHLTVQLNDPRDTIYTGAGEHAGNGGNMVTCYGGSLILYRYQ